MGTSSAPRPELAAVQYTLPAHAGDMRAVAHVAVAPAKPRDKPVVAVAAGAASASGAASSAAEPEVAAAWEAKPTARLLDYAAAKADSSAAGVATGPPIKARDGLADFQGRATMRSRRNMLVSLSHSPDGQVDFQLGKCVSSGAADSFLYTVDFRFPLSPVVAFGLAMTACEWSLMSHNLS